MKARPSRRTRLSRPIPDEYHRAPVRCREEVRPLLPIAVRDRPIRRRRLASARSRSGVQPGDAEEMIDGERWNTAGNERLLVQLAEGRHVVEVRKAGYRPFSTEVQMRAGETAPLNVSLTSER